MGGDHAGDVEEVTSDGGRTIQRGHHRPDRDRASVHEQPGVDRHELPGGMDVDEYHAYFHGGRWEGEETPLRRGEDRDVDWLSSDERLSYDVDVRESGPYDLRLRVAADAAFGGGDVALLVDDEPVDQFNVPPTGGWYEWKTLKGRVELPRGVHRLTFVVLEGGWKLDHVELR